MPIRNFCLLMLAALFSMSVAACGEGVFEAVEPTPSPTPQVEDAAAIAAATPIVSAVDAPTPIPTALPTPAIVLPAPLYFLSDGQIQRLETDGQILTQLTQEAEPITDFDVSPIDASLVYVTDNTLIEANPQYGTRIVKVRGETFDENVPGDAITKRISDPRFSTDGSQIAFGLNGVNMIPVGDVITYTTLLQSDPYPDLNNPPRTNVRFFVPGSWSPDGQNLMVRFSYWPEAGGLAILDLANNSLIPLTADDPNTPLCCDWAWSREGTASFIASNLLAYGVPGLARVDVNSGAATLLIPGFQSDGAVTAEHPLYLFRSPHPQGADLLFAFVSQMQSMDQQVRYRMTRLEIGADELNPLGNDEFETDGDILWARDGSGAALANVNVSGPLGFAGPILWLPANGGSAISLPAYGEQLRWGPSATAPVVTAPTEVEAEDDPTVDDMDGEGATLIAQVLVNVRSGPSTAYAIVGDLDTGESARITGVSPDGGWWQIVYPPDSEERAWVIGDSQFTQAQNIEDIAVVTPPPLPRSVGRIFYSAPSPDGLQSILAQSLAPGASPQVILVDASQPAIRNGRLAVRSNRSDLLGIGIFDIPSGQLTGITSHLEDSNPNWSPDGGRLVFASTRHGDRRWRIYTTPAGSNQTAQELTFGLDPDWHPSADRIVYKGCDDSGERCGLWTMNSSGGNRTPLTADKTDSRPIWSADGRTIVFMSESRHGNWEIYTVDVNSGAVTRLTDSPALDGLPAVSPDGSRVAFVSNRGGSWGIWVVPITGGNAQAVITIGADLPNWLEQGIDWAE
ncbi:MAG: PD40 domain-containing protein [Caldilineaceae bacterium]|nr:PD40 domain-containing protein [Caldilineaceae bacterium]